MELHSDIVKKHAIFQSLDDTTQLCYEILNESTSLTDNIVTEINRISSILIELKALLNEFDESFISINKLNNLNNNITILKKHLNSFKGNKSESELQSTQAPLDYIIDLANLTQYYFNKKNSNLNDKLVIGFNNRIEYEVGKLRNALRDTFKENEELKKEIRDQKLEINRLKDDLQRTLTNNQVQIDNNLQQLRDNNSKFLNESENKIKNTLADSESKIKNTLADYDKKFVAQTEKYQALEKEFDNRTNTIIEENKAKLEEYEKKVENIVGYVNTTMFAHKYKQVADDAKERSFKWNLVTALSLIGAIAMAYFTLNSITESDLGANLWLAIIARSVIIIMLVSFTVYSAKQAEASGKVERYARKIEMELTAFDVFIDNLDDDVKTSLKKAVVERIFIKREDIIDENNNPSESLDFTDKLKTMVEEIVKEKLKKE